MKKILLLVVLLSSIGAYWYFEAKGKHSTEISATSKVEVVNAEEFSKMIEAGEVLLVDVRTPKEFQEGTLEGAVNINFYDADFETKIKALETEKPLYLFCRSGGRSNKAAHQLSKLSFTKIYDMKGGVNAWGAAGKSFVQPE
ncbi:rhodanese-like domain-containing protein [Algivirga pacifica]